MSNPDPRVGRTMFVLEGPDGSGKSTHARKIYNMAEDAGKSVIIFHADPPKKNQTSILPMFLPAFALLEKYEVVIMDRSPVSEAVYGKVLRGHQLGAQWEWLLWLEMSDCRCEDGLVVNKFILDGSIDVLRHRAYIERGENFVPGEKFEEIVLEYRKVALELVDIGWDYADEIVIGEPGELPG